MSPKEGIEGKRRKYENKERRGGKAGEYRGELMEQAAIVEHF